jgi:hypothetical protein
MIFKQKILKNIKHNINVPISIKNNEYCFVNDLDKNVYQFVGIGFIKLRKANKSDLEKLDLIVE